MDQVSIPALVEKYLSAFVMRDRKILEEGLTDDFTFTSPRDDHIDKTAFFERCYPGGELFRSQVIEQIFADGNEAVVRYLAELKDGTKFRNMEFIRFEGDKIKSVDVYFGANAAG
jgi:ketosteroid isomerase-like protein